MASQGKGALTIRATQDVETAYLGQGWAFPVRWHRGRDVPQETSGEELRLDDLVGKRIRVEMVTGLTDIQQSIELILETMHGERVMRPDFGSEAHRYLFASITVETRTNLGRAVRRALLAWEKRIRNIEVDVREHELERGRLDVHIDFDVEVHQMRQSLIYPFYIAHPENW